MIKKVIKEVWVSDRGNEYNTEAEAVECNVYYKKQNIINKLLDRLFENDTDSEFENMLLFNGVDIESFLPLFLDNLNDKSLEIIIEYIHLFKQK